MTFEEYENEAVKTARYTGAQTPLGLAYVALKMNGEAGEFAEHVGKAIRDDDLIVHDDIADYGELHTSFFTSPLKADRRELLIKEVGDVLWYLAAAAKELNTSLSEIAQVNIEKLRDRNARGKLGGSGDNR